jgi:hypothetical protein
MDKRVQKFPTRSHCDISGKRKQNEQIYVITKYNREKPAKSFKETMKRVSSLADNVEDFADRPPQRLDIRDPKFPTESDIHLILSCSCRQLSLLFRCS